MDSNTEDSKQNTSSEQENPTSDATLNVPDETSTSRKNPFAQFAPSARNIVQKLKEKPFFVIVVVLIALIGLLQFRYLSLTKNDKIETPRFLDNVLLVLDARMDDPQGPKSIQVNFNHPVDKHDLTHSALLSPQIEGEWSVDPLKKTVAKYTFKKEYDSSSFTLYLNEGFKSTNNKTLLNNFSRTFFLDKSAEYNSDRTAFYSKVNSYAAGKPIPLYSDATPESILIYKSNVQNLLSFLKYSLSEKDGRGSMYADTFQNKKIKHEEADRVKDIVINDEDDTITLESGVYYVEDDAPEPYFLVVNNFGVSLRQDDKKVLVGAFDLESGKKITEGVTFGLYNLANGVQLLRDFAYTETNNSVPLAYPTRLDVAIAIYNKQIAFVPVEVPSSQADIRVESNLDQQTKIFVYTDRPIYKPGDTVFVRGIVRQDSDGSYKPPVAGSTVYLRRAGFGPETIFTTTLDEFGTFYTHYVLSKDMIKSSDVMGGSVVASMKPFEKDSYTYQGSASFEVFTYTKPEFEIKTSVAKNELMNPEKMKFTISGKYFNGKPLANKEINYHVYTNNYYEVEKAVYNENFNVSSPGGMCGGGGFEDYYGDEYDKGRVTLDAKGQATVEVSADPRSILSQEITLVADVADSNGNKLTSGSNAIVHASEFNIFFIPSAGKYTKNEEVVAPFYAEYATGEKVKNKTFDFKFVDYKYDDSGKTNTAETAIRSGTVETDENGKGIVRFVLPDTVSKNEKQLVVSAKDSKGNLAQNQKSISIIQTKETEGDTFDPWNTISQTYLKISSNQNSFKVGDTITLTIDSPKELDALVTLERGRIYDPQFLHLNQGLNTLKIKVDEKLSPSITVVFSFFSDGKYYSEGLALNVPAMHKLLQIGVNSDKQSYSPNETAELHITTKDADGQPVAAQMSLGIVDKAIYALRKSATPAIHSAFYYFRPRNTNASSSLTRIGNWGGYGGGGGGGGDLPGSTADVLYWNPLVRTDASGEVRLPVPLLGHKTIWQVQVVGSTINSQVGQADTEFIVGSQVKGAKTNSKK